MKKVNYEELIKTLRETQPKLDCPDELTQQILKHLPEHKQGRRLNIRQNNDGWTIFIGFRSAAAVASVFLIGYFAFQQWEMANKVSALEEEVNNQNVISTTIDREETNYVSRVKLRLEQELTQRKVKLKKGAADKDAVIINKEYMNQLIRLIEQLDKENRLLKDEIFRCLPDTIKYNPSFKTKLII